MGLAQQLQAHIWSRDTRQRKVTGNVWIFEPQNLLPGHISSYKSPPPNPSQTVSPSGEQVYKHMSLWRPLSSKPPQGSYMCTVVHAYLWSSEANLGCPPSDFPLASLTGLELLSRQNWLPSKPQESVCLCLLGSGMIGVHQHTQPSVMNSGDWT